MPAPQMLPQTRKTPNVASLATAPPAHTGLPGTGRALDGGTERAMSARFGHDFSRVRIHTDAAASETAASAGANAYAVGSGIVFGPGRYQPGSGDTERLLAHELTHVVQQARFGPGDPDRVSDRGDASEREARAVSEHALAGGRIAVTEAPGAALARDDDTTPGFHGGLLPPGVGYRQPLLGGNMDLHLGPGGGGVDYARGPLHLESGFSPLGTQGNLGLGYGAPLQPWVMDVNRDLGGMSGGINGAMNGGGLGPNMGAIGTGLGTLGDIAGSGGPTSSWGVGIQAQAGPDEQRVMAGLRLNL